MSKTSYAFALKNWGKKGLDPQMVGEFIDALIDEKNEHVTSEELVAAARPHQSPLRPCFTWNDIEAAEKWRRGEAKRLVKQLRTVKGGETTRTQAFSYVYHPDHEGKKVLMSTRSAMGRPEMAEQLIEARVQSLIRTLTFWNNAYGGNAALRALSKDVEKLKRRAQRELMQTI